jgi:hypothetical protein
MKTTTLLGMAALAALTSLPANAGEETNHGAYAASPAHPSTWVVGATRVHQGLRWDGLRRELVAYVKYSTQDWADEIHPAQEDDFSLPFPTVCLDPATNKFMADGMAIGMLHDSFFGHEVTLSPGVALSIHRHYGIVNAALIHEDVSNN